MRFQLSWLDSSICQIYIQPLWRSWSFVYLHHGDSDICILYREMITYVISCIMPIHGHCTLMYPGPLYVFAVMCRVVSLYYADWVAGLPFWDLSSLHFWDGLIMYFGHHMTPMTSHLRGICYSWFYHSRWITLCMAFPCPAANSLDPLDHFCPLMFPWSSLKTCEKWYTQILNL